ncbi:MAG: hypothetical protein K2N45_00505 [Helicobacter japonicus]|nr:hypothetical protein [Helicobacter japonicus]
MFSIATTLYDFRALKSRFDSKFIDKIDLSQVRIDSLRGECTPLALQRLNKIAKIRNYKSFYKVGSTGICLKVKKLYKQDRFKIEFFAIAQHYKLSSFAQRQHAEVLRYILSKKSFNFTEIDMCLDSLKPLEVIPTNRENTYRGTQYKDFGNCKMCVYRKDLKPDSRRPKEKGLIRYELTTSLTLKLAKNKRAEKPAKPRVAVKHKTSRPLNKNIINNINIKLKYKKINKRNKILKTRDFMRKLDTS